MIKRGKLTEADALDINAPLDKTDIILSTELCKLRSAEAIELSHGFIGLRVRGGDSLNVDKLKVSTVKNDAIQLWSGGVSINHLTIRHDAACFYCDENHPDCFQALAMSLKTFKQTKYFDGLYIGYANCKVICHGEDDKKNGFIFSEVCQYKNLILFDQGIDFESNSSAPYFLDIANGTNCLIGSELQPIDPERVSGKAIRIGSTKKNNPKSENVFIHAYEGLEIVKCEGVVVIWYKKDRVMAKTNMEMSNDGVQRLVDSEGSESRIYKDQAGLPTIGVGHLLTKSELSSGKIQLSDGSIIDIRNDREITPSEIRRLLKSDLPIYEKAVNDYVNAEISQDNFDALTHFTFNVGVGAFKNSTLLKRINAGEYKDVPDQMMRWIYITINGQKRESQGLINRREKESAMWLGVKHRDLHNIIPDEPVYYEDEFAETERQVREIELREQEIAEEAVEAHKQSNTQTWLQSRTNKVLIASIIGGLLTVLANVFGLPFLSDPAIAEVVMTLINGGIPSVMTLMSVAGIIFRNDATKLIK